MFLGVALRAQTPPTPPAPLEDYGLKDTACKAGLPCGDVSAVEIVAVVIQSVVGIAGVLAVIMLLYGGSLWLTSAGNEEKIKKARKLITNAVIGLVIILTAFSVSTSVFSVLKRATVNVSTEPVTCPGQCFFSVDNAGFCVEVPEWNDYCVETLGGAGAHCYINAAASTCTGTP